MARIELDDLSHAYAGHATSAPVELALKPLSVTWQQGGAYALLGPSGCGKTTLLNIISGLVRPTGGRVLFDGTDVTKLRTEQRNIAQVFQFPVIYDTMTVGENLAFPLRNRGIDRVAIAARVAEIADMLELTADLHRRARGLTADAKQKISLGRGLVRSDVAAILFDEPLTVIDPQLKWKLRSKLKALHRQLDLTMIYVTHDQTEALTFADTVVVMNEGCVMQAGTPSELFTTPEHTFVGHFIGSPGMNILAARIDGVTASIGGHAIPLARAYPTLSNQAVEVGVRPEFATLSANGGVPVSVDRIEDHGRARYARARIGGQKITARVLDTYVPSGADARVIFEPASVHIYLDGRRVIGSVA